ncbi:hypothetical protein SLS62_010990 [Diatrype stigma]|uniref:Uncharacterized protein n=1 Tax=Diatrype stigma TaxID=117547 RepID=A0AAN9YGR5_9PEZI
MLGEATRDVAMKAPSGTFLDNFSESGLEFHEWVDQMVTQGHLVYPSTNLTAADGSLMVYARDGSGWYVKLKNVGCATIDGNHDLVGKAQEHFCGFVQRAEQIKALEMETDVTRIICNDHKICRLGVRAAFDFFGVFKDVDDFTQLCHEMFDAINNACPGGGGVADTEVGANSGGDSYSGQLESAYALDDGSFTCEQGATRECFDRDVPS